MALGKEAETHKIAQALLELTGEALLTGDFVLMKSCFTLPHTFSTIDGEYVVESEQELSLLFKNIRAEYARQGVTRLDRKILAAKRVSDTVIYSIHITHQFAGDDKLKEPFPVASTLAWSGSEWRIATSNYAVEAGSPQSLLLTGQPPQTTSPVGDNVAHLTPSHKGEKK